MPNKTAVLNIMYNSCLQSTEHNEQLQNTPFKGVF